MGFYRVQWRKAYSAASLLAAWTLVLSGLAACASTDTNSPAARPVLYPNATLNRVGEAQGRVEADACMARAALAGLTPEEKNNAVARGAGAGAATGGVAAAVGALITGRGGEGVVRAGAAGAAVGGSAGAVQGAVRGDRPNGTYRNFVQRCLADKGFDVIGWN
ncbi:MAG TPA: glycine zipper family protein [Polaromonas sp.]|uniref:glycine zipper family protein n=1 Tax=Polaromonas sp. TaxID=1869339 RepID=UPI002D6E2B2D|nr:glycine zipper family protein [Polaromonas sp.]HYW55593.1 glycine zipper family protein [Polaromonas sp.]